MKVTVLYFAQLGSQRGLREEEISTELQTVGSLYSFLSDKYSFRISGKQIRFAMDEEFCTPEKKLRDGATVAFMPPMAGG